MIGCRRVAWAKGLEAWALGFDAGGGVGGGERPEAVLSRAERGLDGARQQRSFSEDRQAHQGPRRPVAGSGQGQQGHAAAARLGERDFVPEANARLELQLSGQGRPA